MKKLLALLGGASVLAFFVTGCETDGRTARIQEKSAVFATLTPEQKKVVEAGAIERGYTADMVYMALGTPKKVRSKDAPEGKTEMWTYSSYYPTIAASSIALNNPNLRYTMMQTSTNAPDHGNQGRASSPSFGGGSTGGPQAGIDPDSGNIQSHTLYIFLLNGVVFDIKIENE
jgi:hypothetical protein